ncbi:MAG TPA: acyclic terpene utilization AtuA family protein [Gemmatimonadales bacterium]
MSETKGPVNGKTVRVASGQGFWGDWLEAPRRQVEGGEVDYLMLDYLAEVTMSILQKQKERDPKMGYARDFVGAMESVLPAVTRRGVRVIANAGGVNPVACAEAVQAMAASKGERLRIGVVTGDDLLPRLDELVEQGHAFANMDTGEPLSMVRDRVIAANAYIGSTPIVEALRRDAQVVVTGRSTDTALTMAPLRHEFGWGTEDWDRLAAGIIAGHILECGAQASGGNLLADWRDVPDLANVGYPIAEASADGTFVVTKHPNTGGVVSVASVTEQLLYEMGDPKSYITPDVVADFTTIRVEQVGKDRVRVHGIQGAPATDKLKVSIAYRAGFKAVGTLVYSWPDALEKAELASRVLHERLDRLGLRFDSVLVEYVGASATHGVLSGVKEAPWARELPEVQLRIGVRGGDRAAVERFTRELAPLVLNGPPSVTGFAGGRPKVEEIVAYWPALVDKSVVETRVEVMS